MEPLNPKIYEVFKRELDKSVSHAAEVLQGGPPEEGTIQDLGRSFHTIRGGAGFLGFTEVAGTAAEMEKLLLKSSEEMEAKLKEAREILSRFTEIVAVLPKPGE